MRYFVVLVFLAHVFLASSETAMEKHGIVPDFLEKTPPGSIRIKYPSGLKVKNGNFLHPVQVKDQPCVKWKVEEGQLYTLLMTDPDVPSRADPSIAEFNHWTVGNISGHCVKKGDVISEFVGSGPPFGTGVHRYIFLVYKQTGGIDFKEKKMVATSVENRTKFSTREFVKKYDLGEPIAGNFYLSEYDDYVPILHAQLGAKLNFLGSKI